MWTGVTGEPPKTERRRTVRRLRAAAEEPARHGLREGVGGKGEPQK